jgi:DNA-binding NarL/FixJ family response regulator
VRIAIRAMLERCGFEVVAEAANGFEAIYATGYSRPDVAVLDLSMPGLDGITCAEELVGSSPSTPVVLLTCHVREHQVVRALRAGVAGYVVKAEAAEHLPDAIRAAAARRLFLSPRARHVAADFVVEADGVLTVRA